MKLQMVKLMVVCVRDCVDCKFSYNNSSDRVRSVIVGLGHGSAWLDCRSCCYALVFSGHLLHFFLVIRLLPDHLPHLRQEKLYLHRRRSLHSWYVVIKLITPSLKFQLLLNFCQKIAHRTYKINKMKEKHINITFL